MSPQRDSVIPATRSTLQADDSARLSYPMPRNYPGAPRPMSDAEVTLANYVLPSLVARKEIFPSVDQHAAALRELKLIVGSRILGLDHRVLYTSKIPPLVLEHKVQGYNHVRAVMSQCQPPIVLPEIDRVAPPKEQLRSIKINLIEVLRTFSEELLAGVQWRSEKVVVDRIGYAAALAKHFGDNCVAVIAYGSSTYSDNPGDYDAFVIVNDLKSGYESAADYKVDYRGKPIHINLLPLDAARELLVSSLTPAVSGESLCPLWGDGAIPSVTHDEVSLMGWGKALHLTLRRRELVFTNLDEVAHDITTLPSKKAHALFAAIAYLPAISTVWASEYDRVKPGSPTPKIDALRSIQKMGFLRTKVTDLSKLALVKRALLESALDNTRLLEQELKRCAEKLTPLAVQIIKRQPLFW